MNTTSQNGFKAEYPKKTLDYIEAKKRQNGFFPFGTPIPRKVEYIPVEGINIRVVTKMIDGESMVTHVSYNRMSFGSVDAAKAHLLRSRV